jgi:hypothetical protein
MNTNTEELKPGYECVFTVTEYYDGPREGIANYRGIPHFYECIFDEVKDNYSEVFRLTPLDSDTFQLAIEDWEVWQRWEFAYHDGKIGLDTHPASPNEANRHQELKLILDRVLVTEPTKAFSQVGQFEVLGTPNLPKGVMRLLQVKWSSPLS